MLLGFFHFLSQNEMKAFKSFSIITGW